MKKILLSLAAPAAAAAAAAAAAQQWRGYDGYDRGYDRSYANRGEDLSYYQIGPYEARIRHAARDGRISWDQARQLLSELHQFDGLAWRVNSGRAGDWDRQELARGLGHVQAGLNVYESRNAYAGRDGYGYGYGRDRDRRDPDRRNWDGDGWRR